MNDKISNINADNVAEKERIQNEFKEQKAALDNQLATLQIQMIEAVEHQKNQQAAMMKIIEKKNYEAHYPIPSTECFQTPLPSKCSAVAARVSRPLSTSSSKRPTTTSRPKRAPMSVPRKRVFSTSLVV